MVQCHIPYGKLWNSVCTFFLCKIGQRCSPYFYNSVGREKMYWKFRIVYGLVARNPRKSDTNFNNTKYRIWSKVPLMVKKIKRSTVKVFGNVKSTELSGSKTKCVILKYCEKSIINYLQYKRALRVSYCSKMLVWLRQYSEGIW